jgi:hypothetical protein
MPASKNNGPGAHKGGLNSKVRQSSSKLARPPVGKSLSSMLYSLFSENLCFSNLKNSCAINDTYSSEELSSVENCADSIKHI